MNGSRPVELRVNSSGKKKYKFQEILHNDGEYLFLVVDGRQKTRLYNTGRISGKNKPVLFHQDIQSAAEEINAPRTWIVAIRSDSIRVDKQLKFHDTIGLSKTYFLAGNEVSTFMTNYCMECSLYGIAQCYTTMKCADEDYDKYVDSSWREQRKEEAKARRTLRRERQSGIENAVTA